MNRDDRALNDLRIAEFIELAGIGKILARLSVLTSDVTAQIKTLRRIERLLTTQGAQMSDVDDRLDSLTAAIGDLDTDVLRELADLQTALNDAGKLTAEQAAKFDAITARIQGIKDAVDTADPQPAAPAEPTA